MRIKTSLNLFYLFVNAVERWGRRVLIGSVGFAENALSKIDVIASRLKGGHRVQTVDVPIYKAEDLIGRVTTVTGDL